jgi:hypothetical protein
LSLTKKSIGIQCCGSGSASFWEAESGSASKGKTGSGSASEWKAGSGSASSGKLNLDPHEIEKVEVLEVNFGAMERPKLEKSEC